ncbi:hypothetical protein GH140_04125 [bacterium]|nr:hypothetical protein [bacterium]
MARRGHSPSQAERPSQRDIKKEIRKKNRDRSFFLRKKGPGPFSPQKCYWIIEKVHLSPFLLFIPLEQSASLSEKHTLSVQNRSSNHGISRSVDRRALAVEAPRFGKGSGAKEDPLQPANYILIFYHIIVENFLKSQKYADYYFFRSVPLGLS